MDRTLTVDFEDVHVVLGRSSVADARTREQLFDALGDRQSDPAQVFCYFATQVVIAEGTVIDERITVFPGNETVRDLYARWCTQTDEMLMVALKSGLLALRKPPDNAEKKQFAPLLSATSAPVLTPIP